MSILNSIVDKDSLLRRIDYLAHKVRGTHLSVGRSSDREEDDYVFSIANIPNGPDHRILEKVRDFHGLSSIGQAKQFIKNERDEYNQMLDDVADIRWTAKQEVKDLVSPTIPQLIAVYEDYQAQLEALISA